MMICKFPGMGVAEVAGRADAPADEVALAEGDGLALLEALLDAVSSTKVVVLSPPPQPASPSASAKLAANNLLI
jgi:hypothetical protein